MIKREIQINKKYRHFKGNEYLVLYLAKHSETSEEFVVYKQLYGDGGVWIRPLDMFLETIERDGKVMERFQEVEE